MIGMLRRLFKRNKRSLSEAYRIIYKKRQELEIIYSRVQAKLVAAEERLRSSTGEERGIYLEQREALNAILSYISKVDLYLLQVLIRMETLMSLSEALQAIRESNAEVKKIGSKLTAIVESYGEVLDMLKDAISGIATVSPSWGPPVNLLSDESEKIIDMAYDELIREAGLKVEDKPLEEVIEELAEAV